MSQVLEITDNEFEQEVLNADKTVLAYFWASWCGPCRLVSPTMNWVAENYGDSLKVVIIEIDPNPKSVADYQVEGVPALRMFRNQEVIADHEGAITKQNLQKFIDSYLN